MPETGFEMGKKNECGMDNVSFPPGSPQWEYEEFSGMKQWVRDKLVAFELETQTA